MSHWGSVAHTHHFWCLTRLVKHNEAVGIYHLDAGGAAGSASHIDLVDAGDAPADGPHNVDHICLKVRDFDEAAIRAYLEGHGVATQPAATRFGADGSGPSINIKDPDGNGLELKGRADTVSQPQTKPA